MMCLTKTSITSLMLMTGFTFIFTISQGGALTANFQQSSSHSFSFGSFSFKKTLQIVEIIYFHKAFGVF